MKSFGFDSVWRRLAPREGGTLSITLVWISTGLFVMMLLLDWSHAVSWGVSISLLGVSRVGFLEEHHLYQFLTAPFVHGGVAHLAFNMLAILMLGPAIESLLGRARFLVLYFVCAWASLVGFLIFASSPWLVAVGASGAIYGILIAQAVFFPNTRLLIFGVFPLKMRLAACVMAGMEFVLTMQGGRGAGGNAGHLFGALAAFPCLFLIRRPFFPRFRQFLRDRKRLRKRPNRAAISGDIPKEL
jgi:membrane associated rhomboid family serine protease